MTSALECPICTGTRGRGRCASRLDRARLGADLGAVGSGDSGFVLLRFFQVLWEFGFTQEADFVAVAEDELVASQVDDGLEALEHVQAQEEVHVFAFHDCEGAGHGGIADFNVG